jgi:hypothetical protein
VDHRLVVVCLVVDHCIIVVCLVVDHCIIVVCLVVDSRSSCNKALCTLQISIILYAFFKMAVSYCKWYGYFSCWPCMVASLCYRCRPFRLSSSLQSLWTHPRLQPSAIVVDPSASATLCNRRSLYRCYIPFMPSLTVALYSPNGVYLIHIYQVLLLESCFDVTTQLQSIIAISHVT